MKNKLTNLLKSLMLPKLTNFENSRTSIKKLLYICEQCLEHDSSWNECKERLAQTIKFEDKMLKMLSGKPKLK